VAFRLFLCYAREDHKWAELLRSHLAPLESTGLLSAFMDRQIEPGAKWNDEIKEELLSADLVLAVVSINLLNSRYAVDVELRTAARRHQERTLTLLPVIADYCDWEATPLGELQALPMSDDGRIKPLVDWTNPHVPLTAVIKALRQMVGSGKSHTVMDSPPPDRSRPPAPKGSVARGSSQPAPDPTITTEVVSARSAEMLNLAFASASTLLARSADSAMWVERLHQRITMTARIDADWSVRYEKQTEMMVEGAGAIVAAPFKITAQSDVMSRLSLFDVDPQYEEVDSPFQPLRFPAFIQGPERGFAMIFAPPITAAQKREFRAWFAVDREFAATVGAGKADSLTCATSQLAHEHWAALEFSVLISAKLPALRLLAQFECQQLAERERVAGLGEPYWRYAFKAPRVLVMKRLSQTIQVSCA
jgi:hypothetical protein